jgi:hypothetical protein
MLNALINTVMKPKYNLKEVDRAEYMRFTKNVSHENMKPTNGTKLSVMQCVDDDGNLIAQALYLQMTTGKCIIHYYIKE